MSTYRTAFFGGHYSWTTTMAYAVGNFIPESHRSSRVCKVRCLESKLLRVMVPLWPEAVFTLRNTCRCSIICGAHHERQVDPKEHLQLIPTKIRLVCLYVDIWAEACRKVSDGQNINSTPELDLVAYGSLAKTFFFGGCMVKPPNPKHTKFEVSEWLITMIKHDGE